MNERTSPAAIPERWNNTDTYRPLLIPVYKEIGYPVANYTIDVDNPSQFTYLPTVWTFYLGFIVSNEGLIQLWLDIVIIVLMNFFFIYFHSVVFELDMNVNSKEAVLKTLQEIDQKVEENLQESLKSSFNGSFSGISNKFATLGMSETNHNLKKTKGFYDATKYMDKVKKKMVIAR